MNAISIKRKFILKFSQTFSFLCIQEGIYLSERTKQKIIIKSGKLRKYVDDIRTDLQCFCLVFKESSFPFRFMVLSNYLYKGCTKKTFNSINSTLRKGQTLYNITVRVQQKIK